MGGRTSRNMMRLRSSMGSDSSMRSTGAWVQEVQEVRRLCRQPAVQRAKRASNGKAVEHRKAAVGWWGGHCVPSLGSACAPRSCRQRFPCSL